MLLKRPLCIFFTADLHFGHANVIKFCARPFADVQEMDAALIANWNKRVGDDDDVWILGDFTFKRLEIAKDYLQQLQGRKHLIIGNHDYFARKHPDELSDVLVEITPYKELKLELSGHTAVLMHLPAALLERFHAGLQHHALRAHSQQYLLRGPHRQTACAPAPAPWQSAPWFRF